MTTRIASLAACLLTLAAAGCASLQTQVSRTPADRALIAKAVVSDWSNVSALAARRLMAQYGPPDDIRSGYLAWNRKGFWKRIIVWDVAPPYVSGEEVGVIEHTIDYPLTARQEADLTAFSRRLIIDRDRGELSVRCDREENAFLSLNLADDVVRGLKTVAQARAAYTKLPDLAASGNSPTYAQGLLFSFGH